MIPGQLTQGQFDIFGTLSTIPFLYILYVLSSSSPARWTANRKRFAGR